MTGPNLKPRDSHASPVSDWLAQAVAAGALDLHILVGYPPTLRLHGRLHELESPVLEGDAAAAALAELCPPKTWARFQRRRRTLGQPSPS